jgi:hypothetical protein
MEARCQPEGVVPPSGPAHQEEGGSKALEWEEALIKNWNDMTDVQRKERLLDLAEGLRLIDKGDELLRTAPAEEKEKESFREKILLHKKLWERMFRVLSALGPVVTHSVYSVKAQLDSRKQ